MRVQGQEKVAYWSARLNLNPWKYAVICVGV